MKRMPFSFHHLARLLLWVAMWGPLVSFTAVTAAQLALRAC
jgi:hypothetical protein